MTQVTKAIIPQKLRMKNMVTDFVQVAQEYSKKMLKDMEKTTATWTGPKPSFKAEVKIDPPNAPFLGQFPSKIIIEVAPKNDGSKGTEIWKYLDGGTKVRRAVMSKGFIAKTKVGQLNSWRGRGKMVFVSKKLNLPGIKARKFSKALAVKHYHPYVAAMRKAMEMAARDSGHGKYSTPGLQGGQFYGGFQF